MMNVVISMIMRYVAALQSGTEPELILNTKKCIVNFGVEP